ncbi:SpoIIE family protein phosphatase [Actinocorallia populi]|uniref:SpoIIE family protein phosphatase n=1 Tax=Actinocorallia populi TaxID=2079200 RepID=UPI00130092F6|nr:SpoIIE family protein phosphatase [Actinocorallia populi]
MRAEVNVEWPEEPLPALGDPAGLPLERLMGELPALWPLLSESVMRTGPGFLWPGSLRWGPEQGWQILCVPPYGAGEEPVPETPGARARDVWSVICGLVTLAVGRAPRDLTDTLMLLELHAGRVPHGLDAVVRALLAGNDPGGVVAAVTRPWGEGVSVRMAAETGVGSRKAKGDPEWDNEDAFAAVRSVDDVVVLAVCDGVTGPGDGSGARAARAAVAALKEYFTTAYDLEEALEAAEAAVIGQGRGASTALLAAIRPDGRTALLSVGDSPAWLVRMLPFGGRTAFRLNPDQTVLAESLLTDPSATMGGSILLGNLGGYADQPFLAEVQTVPGDMLVLLSDGAALGEEDWFAGDLVELTGLHQSAAALAAALVGRAERLGGLDNATALVAEIRPAGR